MKKILTLSIALILVAGIVSQAKSADIDSSSGDSYATAFQKDRHIVKSSNGTIVVIYAKSGDIVAKKSTDNGATWTKLDGTAGYTIIDYSDGYAGTYLSACIDSSDHIYVAYLDANGIYFNKLTYSGGNWSLGTRKDVDIDSYECDYPSIIRESGGRIWIAYGCEDDQDYGRLRAAYATDPYSSWTYTDIVSATYGPSAGDFEPALVIRNNYPFVVYNDEYVTQRKMKSSAWNGSSWSTPITAVANSVWGTGFSVTTIGNDVHLVYSEYSGGIHHRYYNGSWNAGGTLSSDTDDGFVSLTTAGTDLWCFIGEAVVLYESYNIKYKKRSGGTWDTNWTAVTTDNANNRYCATPLNTTDYIPLAWTVGTSPYPVKYDFLDIAAPPPPTGVTATPSGWTNTNSFSVDWTNPFDPSGIQGAYYKLDNPPTSDTDGTWRTSKPITNISVSGDGQHTIYIWLKDNAGNVNYQNQGSTTLKLDTADPGAPTGVTATPSGWTNTNSFSVDWTNPSDPSGIEGAYYKLDNPPTSDTDGAWRTDKPITNISVSGDGEHTIYIWLKDNAGNVNYQNQGSTTLKLDTSDPGAPTGVTATPSGWTNTNSFSVDWTNPSDISGIQGAYYKLDNPPTSDTDGTPTTDKPITDISVSGDGEHTIYIWLKDNAGNVNYQNQGSTTLNLDTTGPVAPDVSSATHPDQATWYTNNDPSLSWTCSDISGITGYSYELDQNPGTIPDDISEGPGTSMNYTDVVNGTWWFHVKAQNGSGLWGDAAHYRINIDTSAPLAPNVTSATHPDQASWYNNNDPSFSWTCNDISGITGYSYELDQNPGTIPDDISEGPGTSTNYTDVVNGTWWFHVKAQNGSGLWGDAAHYRVNIDASGPVAPNVTSATHPDQATWYNNNDPSFSWTCDDISGITGYSYELDQNPGTIPDDISEGPGTSMNYTDVVNGTRWFHVKAQNGAGLWGATAHYRINIDTSAPLAPNVTSATHPDQATWYNNNDPSFSWTCDDISGITGYSYELDQNPGTIPDDTSEGTGTSVNYTDIANGTRWFHVKAQNGAGLWGATAHYRINIDTSAPAAPVVTSLTHPDQAIWYTNNDPSFSWTCDDISGITGYSYGLDQNPGTIPDDTSEGTGTSMNYIDVVNGTWWFHVKAQNGAGVWGATAHYRVNIDASGPMAPNVTSATHPDQASWYTNNDPLFSWSCDDISGITGYSYILDQNSGTIPDDISEGLGTSTNYIDVVDGTWWFHVKAQNGAGLWGATAHYRVNVDPSGPPAPNVTSATHPDQASWYTNNDPLFSWNCSDISGITGYSYVLDQNPGTIPDDTSEGMSTSMNYTDVVNGTWWFHVKAQNGAGLWGATAHYRVNVDPSGPPAPNVTSATHPDQASWYTNNDPLFSWNCSDISGITGYSYVLDQNSGTIPDDTSEGTGTSTNYTDVGDGTWYFHVKAQNGAGLWGATGHYRVNIDTTGPLAPVITSTTHPDQNQWYNNSDPSFSWTCDDISGITGYSYVLDQNSGTIPDDTSEGMSTYMNYTGVADDVWYFHVKARNGSGLWGDTAHYKINIDTSVPPAPNISSSTHPDQNQWYTNNDPSLSWICSDPSGITGYSYILDQNSGTIPDDTSEGTGTSTNYTDVADGTWYFHVKARNGSGLWGDTGHYRINIDATGPVAPDVNSLTHPDQNQWYNNNDPSFSWNATDTSGITGYSYILDQNPGTIPDDISEGTGISRNYTDIADGTWYFHVKARNGSGLWGDTAHYRMNIAVGPPAAPTVSSFTHPDQTQWYSDSDPSFSWSATDPSGITGYSYILNQNPTTIPDDTSEGPGTSTSYTDVADGTWWFHVKARNGAGVWGATAHYRINIDASGPIAPNVSSTTHPDQTQWYNNNDPSFSWGCDDISGITGYSYVLDQNPGTIPDNASEGASTSTSYTDVADGTWWFHVKARNGAGVWGATAHYRVNIDTSGPPAPNVSSITHPDQSIWYNNNDPLFSWSCTDISGITGYSYVLDQNPGTVPNDISEGPATSTSYTDVDEGTWWFHVKAQNGSGLWGATAHYKINVDMLGPAAPDVSSATHPDQNTWYNNNDPSFSWSASDPSGIAGYSYILNQNPGTIPDEISEGTATSTSYTDIADGTWYFHVRAQSGSGLWGDTGHYRVNIDTSVPLAPVVISITHPDQTIWYSNNDPSLSWTCDDISGITGYSYVLDQNSGTIPDDTSEGMGSSMNYTDVADGTWYFHVKARNGSGLWGLTAHYRVNIDASGPAAPNVSSATHPDQNIWYNNNDPSFSWSATDISGITGYSYVLDQNSGTIPDDTSEGMGSFMNYNDVADGVWYFHVKAQNGSGLWGATAHYRVNIDALGPAAPVVTSTTHPDQSQWYSNNDPSFSWSATDISGITGYSYVLDQNSGTIPDNGSEGTSTSTSYTDVADGTWYFHVKAQNGSGIWGDTAHYQVNIDASGPVAPNVSSATHPDQAIWYNNNDPSFSWSATDISGITGYSYVLDQNSGTIPDDTSEGTGTSINYVDIGDGIWYFHVKARNGSGVWGTTTHYRVNIALGPPAAPTVNSPTHPDQNQWYSNDDPSFSWSATDPSGITGYSYVLDQNSGTVPDDTSEGQGTSISYTNIADGTWYFHVKARNGSGLWGDTAHYRVNIDLSVPVSPNVSSITHPDQSQWYTNNDPSFSWSASDISGITGYSYVLDQNSGTIPDDNSEGISTFMNYTDVANGTWYFHVKAQNGSGLWGYAAHYRVNIDATPQPPPAIYQITSVDSARTLERIKLTIELVDPTTSPPTLINGATNPFIITACTASGEDAPGTWEKVEGPSQLNDGRAEIYVRYDTVGTICFKVSDSLGHEPGYTNFIKINPWALRYELEARERVEAGREFSLKVRLIDDPEFGGAGNPVTPGEYDRQVKFTARSSKDGSLAEGELKIKSFYLQGGEKTVLESYNLAHVIYIEASDAEQKTPQSTLGRTADIEVIGAPRTVMKFDGVYNEMDGALYLKGTTRIIIMSISDIPAVEILYRDKGADWITYAEPFTLSPGAHTIEYYGIDKYGHKERINRSKPIYVSFFGSGDGVLNRPNPFKAGRENTLIEYNLEEPSNVTITIYDLFGQEIWHESYAAGENGGSTANQVSWDGRNLSGKVVANGGYICRVWIEREKRHMLGKIAVAK